MDVPDATYSVSSVALWAFAEMTSVILVFTVPAVPKAFGSWRQKFGPMLSSLPWSRLYTGLTNQWRRYNWPRPSSSHQKTPPEIPIYHVTNESGMALQPVTTVTPQESHEHLTQNICPNDAHQSGSILRTTHFSAFSENKRGQTQPPQQQEQNPWEV